MIVIWELSYNGEERMVQAGCGGGFDGVPVGGHWVSCMGTPLLLELEALGPYPQTEVSWTT